MKENEKWVPVYGFENRYVVSTEGRIKSLPLPGHHKEEIVMRQSLTKDGYLCIILTDGMKAKNLRVHRIVLSSFLGRKLDSKKVVNHIDGNKHNNRLSNLEEITFSDNASHAYQLKLRCAKGARNGKAKISEETILKIKDSLLQGESVGSIWRKFGVHQTTVSHIKSGRMWGSVTGWSKGHNFYTSTES